MLSEVGSKLKAAGIPAITAVLEYAIPHVPPLRAVVVSDGGRHVCGASPGCGGDARWLHRPLGRRTHLPSPADLTLLGTPLLDIDAATGD